MSAIPSYTVICDGDCDSGTPNADLGNETAVSARRETKYYGWVTRQYGTDWCPDCQEDGTMRKKLAELRAEREFLSRRR